ncbi:MAG TPA: class I SAM-dependent methyltransferase [Candidatus Binataceae bacterium]|nr:class I SAM-dependent methyltransferase [Candidatus Binataceae bacterium]
MAADFDELLEPYAHDQPEYARAFGTFLTHTDQKTKTIGWLTNLVNGLRSHGLFVDAGAGDGSTTAALAKLFDRTIAIEPNSILRAELARRCPEAEILEATISDARIAAPADFVLCSHVLYYIPQNHWIDTLERLTSWLGAHGVAVLLLGNSNADVIALSREFFGKNIDLAPAVEEFKARHNDFEILTHTLNCEVVVDDLESACTLTRFFLSDYPDWGRRITRPRVEEYVRRHFTDPRGYRLSCDQDALTLRRR